MRQQKRIQGRQGLQLNEQSLQILVETIPALMWRAKPDGRIDYVNKRLLEYFGSPLEEIIGWGWMEKAHPDDVAFKAQTWLNNLETMTPHDVNCRFQGADGAYRWFASSLGGVRAPGRLSRNRRGFLARNPDRNFVPGCHAFTPGGRRVSLAPCSM